MGDYRDFRVSLGMALFLVSLIAADLALVRFAFTSESQLTGVAF